MLKRNSGSAKCTFLVQGVKKNHSKALKWFQRSAELKNGNALYYLGWMYDRGQGVSKDYYKAVRYFRKAAEQGHTGAQDELKKKNVEW